jgi:hypothetical protein
MYELWYHTPTRVYLDKTGSYDQLKIYAKDNIHKLYQWGYYFTIRLNGIALIKIGSTIYS